MKDNDKAIPGEILSTNLKKERAIASEIDNVKKKYIITATHTSFLKP